MNGFQEFRARHMAAGMRQMVTPDIRWEELEDRYEAEEPKCESEHMSVTGQIVACTIHVTHICITSCAGPDRLNCDAAAAANRSNIEAGSAVGCRWCKRPPAECWTVAPWG